MKTLLHCPPTAKLVTMQTDSSSDTAVLHTSSLTQQVHTRLPEYTSSEQW